MIGRSSLPLGVLFFCVTILLGAEAVADLRNVHTPGGVQRVAMQEDKQPAKKKQQQKKKTKKAKGSDKGEKAVTRRGIDGSETWRTETLVFSADQLEKLEPILNSSTCSNEKTGCTYQENGRPGSEASFAFRLIQWKVSRHRGFLVRNDRCSAGGCDEGLFVLIDGQWRMLIETFGVLQRGSSSTLGFRDLTFHPRGQPSVHLVWDGRGYKETTN